MMRPARKSNWMLILPRFSLNRASAASLLTLATLTVFSQMPPAGPHTPPLPVPVVGVGPPLAANVFANRLAQAYTASM